jgi:signal transduction histidine kinase
MRWLPRSAARRIALVAFLAYAAAMLLLGSAVYWATHAAFARQIDSSIEQATTALLAEYRDDGVRGVSEALAAQHAPGPIALGTALFDPDGHRIAGNLDTKAPVPGWRRIVFLDPLEGPDPARAQTTALAGGYRLVVAADLESLESIDNTILGLFAAALIVILLVGLTGALLLSRYLRRRLGNIETTAAAIMAGDMAQRAVEGPAGDEFDRVAASLNAMLDRIAALVANLRQVSADLAHDLRTPLTALRNQLELMRQDGGAGKAEQVDEGVERADYVLGLFSAILRISEVEEGNLKKAFAPVDLSALATDLGETLSLLASDGGRFLDIAIDPGLIVTGDRELLAQAIINLVENALRHTPPGSHVRLGVRRTKGGVSLEVRDNGQGIPEGDRSRVQQRFVRLEPARATPGHGLGLSLVRAIAEAHGTRLTLDDARPGLIAALTFPERPLS